MATHLAHELWASKETIRNRKKKLKERINRLIDNSSAPGNEKRFLKLSLKSIFDELSIIHQNEARKTQ
jgi:DNA-directed RNA polymerase beta' subunit